jgi:hypothetical protein
MAAVQVTKKKEVGKTKVVQLPFGVLDSKSFFNQRTHSARIN